MLECVAATAVPENRPLEDIAALQELPRADKCVAVDIAVVVPLAWLIAHIDGLGTEELEYCNVEDVQAEALYWLVVDAIDEAL